MKISIIIPVFNEAKTLEEIIGKIEALNLEKEIIAVDDGSSDDSSEILTKLVDERRIKFIQHQKNLGKGAAIKSGLKIASGDIVIIQDADLETDPQDYYELIKPIENGETRAVFGHRTNKRLINIFWWGGKLVSLMTKLLYGGNIKDVNNGYKVMTRDLWNSLELKSNHFQICEEITAKLLKRKEKIIQVPTQYFPRTKKEGKKLGFKDGIISIFTLIKYRFWWGIVGLILVRFLLVFLLIGNIPFTDMGLSGFRPNFGGSYWPDEVHYFELAQSFSKLSPVSNVANIGYPLFLAPIIYFTGANSPIDIAKIVFIIQAFLFFSLAIILVAYTAFEIFKKKSLAFITAAVFTFYPYLLLTILKLADFPRWLPAFHYQMWIVIGADYLSAILLYSGFYLFIKKFNTEKLTTLSVILIGILISVAALVRVANILYLPLIFFVLIWLKKYRDGGIFGLTSFLVYLPQWIYNFYFFGSPLTYGYRIKELSGHGLETKVLGGWLSFDNVLIFFEKIWQNLPVFVWILPVLILFIVVGFWRLYKQSKIMSLFLISWPLLNIGFYIFFVDAQSQLRYFIPSILPLIILFISGILYLYEYRRNI